MAIYFLFLAAYRATQFRSVPDRCTLSAVCCPLSAFCFLLSAVRYSYSLAPASLPVQ